MAGPYVGIKLAPNLLFDARVAWGTSQNDIMLTDALAGTRTGSFDTTRWLATASLTGNYFRGPWRWSPQGSLAYGNEKYDSFTNSLGQQVSGSDVSIGRLTVGSEVGYGIMLKDGTFVEPHIGLTGIWNFHSDDLVINGVLVTPNSTRAKIEGGVTLRSPSGLSVRAAVAHDGIGDSNLSATTGKLWVNIPLP
jgi:outer membrane autotransporter protein